MITLTFSQNKIAHQIYAQYAYIGENREGFLEMRNLFLEGLPKNPHPENSVCYPLWVAPNIKIWEFEDFMEDFYIKKNRELKSLLELNKLDFEPNNEQLDELNNQFICATCKRKFAGIKALHGHKNKCKPN